MSRHVGRSWEGNRLEADCPCTKAACGLVEDSQIKADCPEHSWRAAKTIRQMHSDEECAGSKILVKESQS